MHFHGGAHIGAAAMASRARASIELQHRQGRSTLMGLLDCIKCFGRVGHAMAGGRALMSGLPGRTTNMVFSVHGADRHIKAHGAVAPPQRGNRGLIAGCAIAKDFLKAFLAEPLRQCLAGQPRDHVDDMTLQITEAEPGLCARMESAPRGLPTALEAETWSLTQASSRCWVSPGPLGNSGKPGEAQQWP